MATDPHAPAGPASSGSLPAIENEIPAYRAISSLAIVSLLMGLGSLLAFAYWTFAVLGLGAVGLGLLADRKIRRHPDMLTGRGLAQAGVALGLVFSLSALTFDGVRYLEVRRSAVRFSRRYLEVLAKRSLPDACWFQLPPSYRNGTTPKKWLAEIEKGKNPGTQEQIMPLRQILDEAGKPGHTLAFVGLEAYGFEGVTPYAVSVLAIHGPDRGGKPGVRYAMLELRSDPASSAFNWYVPKIQFPYTLESHKLKPPPIDDGHGHAR